MLRVQSPPSSVSQRVPENEPPPCSPKGALMERVAYFQTSFYIFLEFINKFSPNKSKFHPSLEGRRKGTSTHFPPPQTGPLWKEAPTYRALLNIYFGVPSEGTLPPGFPHRAHAEGEVPFLELSIYVSKSPVNEPPFRFP